MSTTGEPIGVHMIQTQSGWLTSPIYRVEADASICGYSGALGHILKVTVEEDEGAWHLLHRIQAIAQEALTGKR